MKLLSDTHKKNTRLMFLIFSIFAIAFGAWMFLFTIDIISNAEGPVIPVGEVKTIQHLEGGIIDQILVNEAEIVEKDQPLVILAATASKVEGDEVQVQIDSEIIKSIRLEAEINSFDVPIFPENLVNERPDLINKSMELYLSKKDKYEGEIEESKKLIEQYQMAVDILIRQAEMSAQLLEEKVTNEYAHLGVLKELNSAKGQLEEQIEKKENITKRFVQDSRNELQVAQRELSELNETIKALKDNLDRTVISAPVDGIVKNLFFVTEGGVIRSGEAILDIVPTKDSLIVEARLLDSDIGFVKPGQSAVVKLSSADSVNFGQINAVVTQISPDTEQDENDKRIVFYKILLQTEKNYFESKNKIYQLVPGVKVVASIHIGQRTVANYLLSPFIGTLGETFQER